MPISAPGPTGLPVEDAVDGLRAALADGGTCVLEAPPGAGKTTVIPLRLLAEPWLGDQRILMLEPRRLAARAAATRMAELLDDAVGGLVGFRTRDEQRVSDRTRVEVLTEGILIRMLQEDPALTGTGLVILDEVHERNLVTDLSLALLVDARRGLRSDLRLLAMSATIEADRYAAVLGETAPSPVVRSEGRRFPVEIIHDALAPGVRLDAHVARAVGLALDRHPDGDLLVFLPGAADIRRVQERLTTTGALADHVDVRPLFGGLGAADQDLALRPSAEGRRRVVLATDIAESSLTVAGVRTVVDAGLVRVPRHDAASAMTRLQTEPASRASANQRAGRAGRVAAGAAIRLWDQSDGSRRPRYPVPEIEVADLTSMALEVAVWGAQIGDLALPQPPPAAAWEQALDTLRALDAIDDAGRPTPKGRSMVALPLHPRLAALALAGRDLGAGWTGAVVAAVLEERDVLRGRPGELPVDLAIRAELVADAQRRHPAADRGALASARRRAKQVARRIGAAGSDIDLDMVGRLVAVAYPERISQAQGGGGFRLRGGGGGAVPATDPLARSAFLAVARVESGFRGPEVRLAAHLDPDEVRAAVEGHVTERVTVSWDAERNDVRARREQVAGALVLSTTEGSAEPGAATTQILLDRVIATGGALLGWSKGARTLQGRLGFLHGQEPGRWADVSDEHLLATLEEWLVPMAPGLHRRSDLERVDIAAALRSGLDHRDRRDLDRLAPTSFTGATGRSIPIDYSTGSPRASTRVQDLYGTTVHPTVADGAVPVVIELLSPARRPIQVTADLPGFWTGSWSEVRKDMAGRYPKHPWPTDPANPSEISRQLD